MNAMCFVDEVME